MQQMPHFQMRADANASRTRVTAGYLFRSYISLQRLNVATIEVYSE